MLEIGTYEAKTRFSELLERVEGGETIVITRHGKPVARLVADPAARAADRRELIAGMLRERAGRPPVTQAEIRAWRDEGRR